MGIAFGQTNDIYAVKMHHITSEGKEIALLLYDAVCEAGIDIDTFYAEESHSQRVADAGKGPAKEEPNGRQRFSSTESVAGAAVGASRKPDVSTGKNQRTIGRGM